MTQMKCAKDSSYSAMGCPPSLRTLIGDECSQSEEEGSGSGSEDSGSESEEYESWSESEEDESGQESAENPWESNARQ